MCVCERERERERITVRERERERERERPEEPGGVCNKSQFTIMGRGTSSN